MVFATWAKLPLFSNAEPPYCSTKLCSQSNPDTLEWAIERSGNTVESLEKDWSKIGRWLDGDAAPTPKQMEAFAKKTKINFNLLFAETVSDLELQIADF